MIFCLLFSHNIRRWAQVPSQNRLASKLTKAASPIVQLETMVQLGTLIRCTVVRLNLGCLIQSPSRQEDIITVKADDGRRHGLGWRTC